MDGVMTAVKMYSLGFVLLGVLLFTQCDGSPSRYSEGRHSLSSNRALFVKASGSGSLVRSSRVRRQAELKPVIQSIAIVSNIYSRFAQVAYTSVLTNEQLTDLESQYTLYIPETAFISNFTMLIDGELYVAEIDSKEAVDKRFEEAKNNNVTAGKVESKPPAEKERFKDTFSVSVNVAASSSVELVLSYMELLERRLGIYEHSISIRPSQVVETITADVYIYEPQGIALLEVSDPLSSSAASFVSVATNDQVRHVNYAPTMAAQLMVDEDKLNGELVVLYDINHSPNDAGLVLVDNGYFVQYFSPSGLERLDKNVVFVIDRSGSMSGQKIEQVHQSLNTILDQLSPGDTFQLILFNHTSIYWPSDSGNLTPASPENIEAAKAFLDVNLKASGGTNINDPLVEACNALNNIDGKPKGANMIAFLTDGMPTAGVTQEDLIVANVVAASKELVSVFSLGFGANLNLDLIRKISYKTGGFARRIYPGSDAVQQLDQFLAEINGPLIFNVQIEYEENAVFIDTVTATYHPQYFNGSELVVSGQLKPDAPATWTVRVVGETTTDLVLERVVGTTDVGAPLDIFKTGFVEKLWAYMTIKALLRDKLTASTEEERDKFHQEAVKLALHYHLVTDVTSMIIVDNQNQESTNDAQQDVAKGGASLPTNNVNKGGNTPPWGNNGISSGDTIHNKIGLSFGVLLASFLLISMLLAN